MTVLAYLTDRLGLTPDRATNHLRSEFVRVYTGDTYEAVTDGDRELGPGERVVLQPPAVTEQT